MLHVTGRAGPAAGIAYFSKTVRNSNSALGAENEATIGIIGFILGLYRVYIRVI